MHFYRILADGVRASGILATEWRKHRYDHHDAELRVPASLTQRCRRNCVHGVARLSRVKRPIKPANTIGSPANPNGFVSNISGATPHSINNSARIFTYRRSQKRTAVIPPIQPNVINMFAAILKACTIWSPSPCQLFGINIAAIATNNCQYQAKELR